MKQPGSGLMHMDQYTLNRLQAMRDICGFPLEVTSGYRNEAHNKAVGGEKNSWHIKGKAVDLKAPVTKIYEMVGAAIQVGFSGIGIRRISGDPIGLLHVDTRDTGRVIWTYPARGG